MYILGVELGYDTAALVRYLVGEHKGWARALVLDNAHGADSREEGQLRVAPETALVRTIRHHGVDFNLDICIGADADLSAAFRCMVITIYHLEVSLGPKVKIFLVLPGQVWGVMSLVITPDALDDPATLESLYAVLEAPISADVWVGILKPHVGDGPVNLFPDLGLKLIVGCRGLEFVTVTPGELNEEVLELARGVGNRLSIVAVSIVNWCFGRVRWGRVVQAGSLTGEALRLARELGQGPNRLVHVRNGSLNHGGGERGNKLSMDGELTDSGEGLMVSKEDEIRLIRWRTVRILKGIERL